MAATKKRERRYNYAHIEAALCLWESFMDIERLDTPLAATFREEHSNLGAGELRYIMHLLAVPACKMWGGLTADEWDRCIFDWEFIPAFLTHAVDWESDWDVAGGPKVFKDGWHRMKAHGALKAEFAP